MPLLSQRSALAITAVVEIALFEQHGPMSAAVLTKRLKVGRRHLEQVLQACVRNGILKTARGPTGGYLLARDRRHISAYDILHAAKTIDGVGIPISHHYSGLIDAVVAPALARAEQSFAADLKQISVEDLSRLAALQGLSHWPKMAQGGL